MTALVLAAGCTDVGVTSGKIEASYKDADYRYYDNVGGMADTTKTINVPAGSTRLTVKAIYNCGGMCEFSLKNPLGRVEQEDEIQGGGQTWDDQWYTTADPSPGAWHFEIEIQGGAQYAFGIYLEP